jgi:hypothetical protein
VQDSFSATYSYLQPLGHAALNASLNGTTATSLEATGDSQATAYPITTLISIFTEGDEGTGALLPAYPVDAQGFAGIVIAAGPNNLVLYPSGTATINGGAGAAPVLIPTGTLAWIFLNSPTEILVR